MFLHDTKSFSGQTKTGERVTVAPTLLGLTVGVSLPRAVLVKHPGGVFNLSWSLSLLADAAGISRPKMGGAPGEIVRGRGGRSSLALARIG